MTTTTQEKQMQTTESMTRPLSAEQLDSLQKFAGTIGRFNAGFSVFDTRADCLLDASATGLDGDVAQIAEYADRTMRLGGDDIQRFGQSDEILTVCLKGFGQTVAVAVVDTRPATPGDGGDISDPAAPAKTAALLLRDSAAAHSADTEYLAEILGLFAENFNNSAKAEMQIENICTELSQTYEELMLLCNLSSNMNVTQSDCTYLQMACDELTQLVSVEGIAIFLEKKVDGEERFMLTAGSGVVAIDHVMADILQIHLARELSEGKEALLDSHVDSPFKYQWPERIKNIIAVPLAGSEKMIGVMVATNVVDKPDFDSTDVKLFNTVAHQCAVFMENERLFGDLKELFIGALKALTSSIDAKDQYTRGHSERVAFISRWIAERLAETRPLSDDQIHKIYLSGLLHDVGKIGVNEAVLCKKGKLTEDELARIKSHPQIGASILSEIKQMKDIVPGVLCHHERIDGKGYPKGLKGDRIPLIGKIISLADAFDAMTSRRVYREALSIKAAIVEIRKGIGTQFDEEIATVFLDSDIRKLWDIVQDGFIERWDYSNFSEYGGVAVGTLIK
mgnify:CR=1 FL=1